MALPSLHDHIQIQAEKHKYLLLALSMILSALLRLPYFQYEFIFVDEAWWANGANILHQGGQLYRDIALDKNPPIFWLCAFLFKLFGVNMTAIHTGALLLVCITSGLLYLAGSRFFSAGVGAAAALIHAVASTTYYIPRIIGMNTETLMVVFSSGAAFCYLRALAHKGRSHYFLAGFLASLAFLTKPVAITEMAMLVFFLAFARDGNLFSRFRSLLALLAGFALALGLFLGYMVRAGIMWAWWDQAFLYGFRYVGRIGAEAFITKSFRASLGFVCIFAWLFALIWLSRRARGANARAHTFLICWGLSAFVGVAVGRRYYANYFIQVLPPLSLLGGIGLAYLWNNRNQGSIRLVRRVCCAAFMISFLWFHSRTLANWCSLAFPQIHRMKLWDMWDENKRNLEVAMHLRRESSSWDSIFVWGSKAQLFSLAGRPMATSWVDFDVTDDYPPRAAEPSIQIRTAEILDRKRPRYIVDAQAAARIERFPHFRNLVEKSYEFDSQIEGIRLYRLRQAKPPSDVQVEMRNSGIAADSGVKTGASTGIFR